MAEKGTTLRFTNKADLIITVTNLDNGMIDEHEKKVKALAVLTVERAINELGEIVRLTGGDLNNTGTRVYVRAHISGDLG